MLSLLHFKSSYETTFGTIILYVDVKVIIYYCPYLSIIAKWH